MARPECDAPLVIFQSRAVVCFKFEVPYNHYSTPQLGLSTNNIGCTTTDKSL